MLLADKDNARQVLPRAIDETPIEDDDSDEEAGYLMPEPDDDPDYGFSGEAEDFPEEWTELGPGGIRRLRFNEPMTISTLTGHRRVPAFGLAGGEPGALGRHWIEHPDGTVTQLRGCDTVYVEPGDVFVIETPGGGGYGPPVAGPDRH